MPCIHSLNTMNTLSSVHTCIVLEVWLAGRFYSVYCMLCKKIITIIIVMIKSGQKIPTSCGTCFVNKFAQGKDWSKTQGEGFHGSECFCASVSKTFSSYFNWSSCLLGQKCVWTCPIKGAWNEQKKRTICLFSTVLWWWACAQQNNSIMNMGNGTDKSAATSALTIA